MESIFVDLYWPVLQITFVFSLYMRIAAERDTSIAGKFQKIFHVEILRTFYHLEN